MIHNQHAQILSCFASFNITELKKLVSYFFLYIVKYWNVICNNNSNQLLAVCMLHFLLLLLTFQSLVIVFPFCSFNCAFFILNSSTYGFKNVMILLKLSLKISFFILIEQGKTDMFFLCQDYVLAAASLTLFSCSFQLIILLGTQEMRRFILFSSQSSGADYYATFKGFNLSILTK